MASGEDTIVAKLEWAKLAESDRQLRDVADMMKACGDQLDRRYIERGVAVLELAEMWARVAELGRKARRPA